MSEEQEKEETAKVLDLASILLRIGNSMVRQSAAMEKVASSQSEILSSLQARDSAHGRDRDSQLRAIEALARESAETRGIAMVLLEVVRGSKELTKAQIDALSGQIGHTHIAATEAARAAKKAEENTDPNIVLPDRRQIEKPRPVSSMTVVEAAKLAWPILRKFFPWLVAAIGSTGLWKAWKGNE